MTAGELLIHFGLWNPYATDDANGKHDQDTEGLVRLLDKLDEVGFAHPGTYRSEKSPNRFSLSKQTE